MEPPWYSTPGFSEKLSQKLSLLTTGLYDLQHSNQPHPRLEHHPEWVQHAHLPTQSPQPQPLPNHLILSLTSTFIMPYDIFELTATNNQYTHTVNSDPDFMLYDYASVPLTNLPYKSSTPTLQPPLHCLLLRPMVFSTLNTPNHPMLVSSPPNFSLTTGVASPKASTPGCPLSWTNSPWPGVTTLPNLF